MADFEYHMARVRNICDSKDNNNNNELCQSLLSHLDSVILDTRSALVASSISTNDAQQVHDLVRRLYDENQRIANHIDHLIEQDQPDIEIRDEPPHQQEEEDHIQKAIEQIELALEQNIREQQHMTKEQEHFENNQKTIETFIQTTEQLHEEALEKLREHVKVLREHNQSLKQYNEQIDILTKQFPQTLFLSAQ
jgi:prophage DNA circulation protein